ncbi:MAG: hypothetical protein Q8Q09_20550 [Deltaproteobacteria bacterium]|nr:hypothetical protein [Deltaproteobacteria bacterium]
MSESGDAGGADVSVGIDATSGRPDAGTDVPSDVASDGSVVVRGFPRPIAPISLGDVSLRTPTLRWVLLGGSTGAQVELCRDRACTRVIETLRAVGTSARPTAALPASAGGVLAIARDGRQRHEGRSESHVALSRARARQLGRSRSLSS